MICFKILKNENLLIDRFRLNSAAFLKIKVSLKVTIKKLKNCSVKDRIQMIKLNTFF